MLVKSVNTTKNGLKLPRQKSFLGMYFPLFTRFKPLFAPTSQSPMSKLFRFSNFTLLAGFFGIGATIRIGGKMLCLPYEGFFLNTLLLGTLKISEGQDFYTTSKLCY